jgi:tetratricopeptide (TPR) repeat protein
MTMKRLLPKLLLAASLCASPSALAEGPKPGARPGAAKSAPDHADELFEQGAAAYDAGRLPEAQAKLEQAWALKKTHDIAGNLGVVELKLSKFPQAAEHLSWALQHFPPTEADQAKRGFEKQLAKARAECGAVRVRVNVEGAEVTVNGRATGAALGDEVFVEAGMVRVTARRDGYLSAEKSITVAKGEASEVSLTLTLTPVGARGPLKPVLVAGGVTAGAALVAGVVFTLVANAKASDAADTKAALIQRAGAKACTGAQPSGCATLVAANAAKDAFADAALWSFVAAGAIGAGTAVYALAAPRGEHQGTWRAAPVVTAQGGGIMVGGAW